MLREEVEAELNAQEIKYKFYVKPHGDCLEVSHNGQKVDYWLKTGKWYSRTGIAKGRGVHQLIRHLTGVWGK